MFLTIANFGNTLPLIERFNTIYPRYLEPSISTEPGGLAVRPFRDGTPYQGEDMLYDSTGPERFLVRCTRDGRNEARHRNVPVRTADRTGRHHRTLPARMAVGLGRRCRRAWTR